MASRLVLVGLLCVQALAQGQGTGAWTAAYQKARTTLAKLNNNDKVKIVTGVGWSKGPCVGNTAAVSSIGYPSLCLQDGPLGIRYVQGVTAFPAGVQAAATWDTALMNARGAALGVEAKGVGVHVQLGPVAGPLGKIPQAGRNWEGFAADPYLTGIAMAETIKGMQGAGVQACAKHYIGNEQERNRDVMSSNIDDRTMHELYLWPFADAVNANVASVMCSYNKLNSTYACENDKALNGLLKGELNFQGYVMSDWNAQHTTIQAATGGLDMSMPGTDFSGGNLLWGQNLLNSINSGGVKQSRLDDMVVRILAAWYLLKQDAGYPAVTWSSWNGGKGAPSVSGGHATVARQIARDGIVLLKNNNKALPLVKPASIALIGQDAIVNPAGANACVDRGCNTGHLAVGWGSGTADFPYLVAPADAIRTQSAKDGTKIISATTDDVNAAASAASQAATAIVFITADSGEEYITVEGNKGDRNNLDPWHSGNQLVQAVAQANKNTIVVVHSVGPIILETILAQPNVQAVVWAGLPGQESGNGLADVLYGLTSPSGKLPYTIAKSPNDYGVTIQNGDDNFAEGLFIDYRHFDAANIAPRYEFGFGLSYTTFAYSALSVSTVSSGQLFDNVATVKATIRNNGTVTGAEVAQLYIGLPAGSPASPPKQLRGFQKLSLAPGATQTVTFNIRKRDLSYWDAVSQSWKTPTSGFAIYVGSSSRDIRLQGKL
ncbi:Glycosyl hydrolase family 3 C-terminal domain-containing protein 9 [Elsinoe fawcettii]|nr:Glycosyl hydrolase family 3 C-terminal domain-containing protein 9 [Elsinoe fawcettii]